MKKILFCILLLNSLGFNYLECKKGFKNVSNVKKNLKEFALSSPDFENMGNIPEKYTCDGENISPKLTWKNAPENTKSFALIVDDPDAIKAVGKLWVHWVVYNISSDFEMLLEGVSSGDISFGINDFGKNEWGGPCPPNGKHKYVFTLYALDTKLDLSGDVNKDNLLKSIKNHIISQAQLFGFYQRKNNK